MSSPEKTSAHSANEQADKNAAKQPLTAAELMQNAKDAEKVARHEAQAKQKEVAKEDAEAAAKEKSAEDQMQKHPTKVIAKVYDQEEQNPHAAM